MLQQTQVKTVVPFFNKFLEKYPNLDALLEASEDEILAQWSGLGFYRRAKNIYKACRVISENFNNKLPSNINDLESLPGIGRSTAGAIMSIAFNEGHPILDANVKRVLGRYKKISFKKLSFDREVSKVSIIGVGMITTPGITYRMFQALASQKINIQVISTSEIKISVLVSSKNVKKAVAVLHKEFKLD